MLEPVTISRKRDGMTKHIIITLFSFLFWANFAQAAMTIYDENQHRDVKLIIDFKEAIALKGSVRLVTEKSNGIFGTGEKTYFFSPKGLLVAYGSTFTDFENPTSELVDYWFYDVLGRPLKYIWYTAEKGGADYDGEICLYKYTGNDLEIRGVDIKGEQFDLNAIQQIDVAAKGPIILTGKLDAQNMRIVLLKPANDLFPNVITGPDTEEYRYDAKGRLTGRLEQNRLNSSKELRPFKEEEYLYDSNGLIMERKRYFFQEDGTKTPEYRNYYSYDNKDRMITDYCYSYTCHCGDKPMEEYLLLSDSYKYSLPDSNDNWTRLDITTEIGTETYTREISYYPDATQ